MKKTMKKFLSVLLTILMVVTNASVVLAAGDGEKQVIDVSDGENYTYYKIDEYFSRYDEDGYIITGDNADAGIELYYSCDVVLKEAQIGGMLITPVDSVNLTLDNVNEVDYFSFNYAQSLVIDGDENSWLYTPYLYGSASNSTITVNGGHIVFDFTTDENKTTFGANNGFIINGGVVDAANNYYSVVDSKITLNGGELNLLCKSEYYPCLGADTQIVMKEGAVLTLESENSALLENDNISTDADYTEFYVRFDTESDFEPVDDIRAALEGKTYAQIKVDHEHVLEQGKCTLCEYCEHNYWNEGVCLLCGFECPHHSISNGVCGYCGYEFEFPELAVGERTEIAVLAETGYTLRIFSPEVSGEYTFKSEVSEKSSNPCPSIKVLNSARTESIVSDEGSETFECSAQLEGGESYWLYFSTSSDRYLSEDEYFYVTATVKNDIKHQPTSEEPWVELIFSDEVSEYQWYSVEHDALIVKTPENSTAYSCNGNTASYNAESGFWSPILEEGVAFISTIVSLKAGETCFVQLENFDYSYPYVQFVNVTDQSASSDLIWFDYDTHETVEFVPTVDGDYAIHLSNYFNMKIYVKGDEYTKIESETEAMLKSPVDETLYYCEVELKDGTILESDIFEYQASAASVTDVKYTPSTDTHNTFVVSVNGRPAMLQFIEEDGGTRTYFRENKNVTIVAYDADGNEVNSLDRTASYEVWTIYTNLIGPDVKLRAKFVVGDRYMWEYSTYNFTLEFEEYVPDFAVYGLEGEETVLSSPGPAVIKVTTGADVQGIRFVMVDGTTTTYYAEKAEVLEDGKLVFTGKAWGKEYPDSDGENNIKLYIRYNGTWNYYRDFTIYVK